MDHYTNDRVWSIPLGIPLKPFTGNHGTSKWPDPSCLTRITQQDPTLASRPGWGSNVIVWLKTLIDSQPRDGHRWFWPRIEIYLGAFGTVNGSNWCFIWTLNISVHFPAGTIRIFHLIGFG
jgi:hypothetical protein